MMIKKMNGPIVSLSAETFLNTGQFCLVTKPASLLRTLNLSVRTRDDPNHV